MNLTGQVEIRRADRAVRLPVHDAVLAGVMVAHIHVAFLVDPHLPMLEMDVKVESDAF